MCTICDSAPPSLSRDTHKQTYKKLYYCCVLIDFSFATPNPVVLSIFLLFAGNLDFENLSHSLHEVWTDFGQGSDSYLYRADLVKVCERVGLSVKIAAKVADEVFEKLELDPHTHRISFGEFISLIQSDTTDVLGVGTSSSPGIHCLTDRYAPANDNDDDADGGADDSLSCISSSTMTITGRTERSITCTKEISSAHELHASHSGLLFHIKVFVRLTAS